MTIKCQKKTIFANKGRLESVVCWNQRYMVSHGDIQYWGSVQFVVNIDHKSLKSCDQNPENFQIRT